MKSRICIWLTLLVTVPGLPVSAQVLPLGRVPHHGGVQTASCQSCAEPHVGFYGTVWGTSCADCNMRPGLFPPCPNPCQTTLLGELAYDVRTAVDGTLSHVFGFVFGNPCGCRGTCTCVEPSCDTCGGDGMCGAGMAPEMTTPTMHPTPASSDYQGDPFGDDPLPSPSLQPIPNGSTTRSLLPRRQASTQRRADVRMARRVSHEAPVAADQETIGSHPQTLQAVAAEPLRVSMPTVQHYQPRRAATLRRAGGEVLEQSPVRSNGTPPSLRFRTLE